MFSLIRASVLFVILAGGIKPTPVLAEEAPVFTVQKCTEEYLSDGADRQTREDRVEVVCKEEAVDWLEVIRWIDMVNESSGGGINLDHR